VLDICLPRGEQGACRRAKIEALWKSDPRRVWISLFKLGGASEVDITEWAQDVADQMLPGRISSVRRQRWLTSVRPVRELTLLSAFGLLDAMLELFYARCRGKPAPDLTPAREFHAVNGGLDDSPMSDHEDDAPGGPVPVNPDGSADWSRWNKCQQRTVERFRRTRPAGPLMILAIVSACMPELVNWILDIHSEAWDAKQRAEYASTGRMFNTIGMEIARGLGFDQFRKRIEHLLSDPTAWCALPRELWTVRLRALASSLISKVWCGVQMLVIEDTLRSPHDLDRLLIDPTYAVEVARKPRCRREPVVENILERYPRTDDLLSRRCLQNVWIKSYLHPRCSMRIESRMSFVRSLIRQRQATWKKTFMDVNAEWYVLQSRRNETSCTPLAGTVADTKKSELKVRHRRTGVFKGCRTGGGGKRRASLSACLPIAWDEFRQANGMSRKPTKNERKAILKRAHALAKVSEEADPESALQKGKAATFSHRVGARSFGARMARIRKRTREATSIVDVLALDPVASSSPATTATCDTLAVPGAEADVVAVTGRKRRKVDLAAERQNLEMWALTHSAPQALGPKVLATVPEMEQATPWPAAGPNALKVVKWPPPAGELASKVMTGLTNPRDEQANSGGLETLDCAWSDRCAGIMFKSCPPLVAQPSKSKICMIANKCFCGTAEGRNTIRFVRCVCVCRCLSSRAGSMIAKGSYGRTLYESARAVLRVFRKGKADVLRRKDYWLHLGFGNINTGVFFGLELSGCSETVWGEGLWQITLKIENKPVHLWDFFENVNVNKNWDAELWEFAQDESALREFDPRIILLQRPETAILDKVWRTNPPVMLPIGRRPGPGGPHDPPAPVPIEDWTLEGPDEPEPDCFKEKLDGAAKVLRVLRKERAKAKAKTGARQKMQLDDWVLETSSDSSGGEGGGGGGGGFVAPPVAPDPPPDVAVPHPPPPEHSPHVGPRGLEWLRIVTPDARFVLNPYDMSITCHCLRHKKDNCKLVRKSEKQPIGIFMAWLAVASQPEYDSKALHHASALDCWDEDGVTHYTKRCAGRVRAETSGLHDQLFDWEVPKRGAEPARIR